MILRLVCCLILLCSGAQAQVTIDPARTVVRDGWWQLEVQVGLSKMTPYRLFTLDNPRRLVVDFQDVVWPDIAAQTLVSGDRATGLRFGAWGAKWGRMVVDLAGPMAVQEAAMQTGDQGAQLTIILGRSDAQSFAAAAGAPAGADDFAPLVLPRSDASRFRVVIDPGHGGIDPGALREGLTEAALMLQLGREVVNALDALEGVDAVLTREADVFVPLYARVQMARDAGADLFISLHADALEEDAASGASVYTLSTDGGSVAADRMIARHEAGDLLAGVDLAQQGDSIAALLMDLARDRTGPQGHAFAEILIAQMQAAGVRVNSSAHRSGQLAVLSAADFPSVLVEVGFLSNAQDRADLIAPQSRARIVTAIVAAVNQFAR
ncbi:N-acetylmuramoyl-L-alanine amidase [Yoonia tamlensis]|uniref:N-acetylmuramoyl-L-alanine amidase n=1 Tax=Yoonia tamlensis TaxID=390270 RepID=A0A1I6G4N6_9RHOB|nr:N-acetylmuramoyl-L-alanine amidase [Yoonia tamlensis]SFR37132.1 N-acetylmuramoyl-L-alanine amidase [Yoonia tamlensis]